jgi:hypothetical protein
MTSKNMTYLPTLPVRPCRRREREREREVAAATFFSFPSGEKEICEGWMLLIAGLLAKKTPSQLCKYSHCTGRTEITLSKNASYN